MDKNIELKLGIFLFYKYEWSSLSYVHMEDPYKIWVTEADEAKFYLDGLVILA